MASTKKHLKAVIFDMDGTILDTEGAWTLAIHQVLKELKVTYSQEEYDRYAVNGQSVAVCAKTLKDGFNIDAHEQYIEDSMVQKALAIFAAGVSFIKGFESFHHTLTAYNLKSGLATNTCNRTLATLRASMNLDKFFGEHLYNVSHVKHPKPAPDLFLHAAAKLGAEPHECIVFEDSFLGFQAAQAAGIPCIAIRNADNKHLLNRTVAAVDHYHGAMELLQTLFHI